MLEQPGAVAVGQRHLRGRAAAGRRDPDDVGGRRDVYVERTTEIKVLNRGPTPGRGLLRAGLPLDPPRRRTSCRSA